MTDNVQTTQEQIDAYTEQQRELFELAKASYKQYPPRVGMSAEELDAEATTIGHDTVALANKKGDTARRIQNFEDMGEFTNGFTPNDTPRLNVKIAPST